MKVMDETISESEREKTKRTGRFSFWKGGLFGTLLFLTLFHHESLLNFCHQRSKSEERHEPYTKIEIKYLRHSLIPFFNMEIDGKSRRIGLDLGQSAPLALHKRILKQIWRKKRKEDIAVYGFNLKYFRSKKFQLPSLKMGIRTLEDPEVWQINPAAYAHARVQDDWNISSAEEFRPEMNELLNVLDGFMGWQFFKDANLMMDGQKGYIYLIDDLNAFQREEGYDLEEFVKLPFLLTEFGVAFVFQTDLGPQRFLLDTGCVTAIQAALVPEKNIFKRGFCYFTTQKVKFGGVNLGKWDFRLMTIPDAFGFDGFLGVDFCIQPIYLDFTNKVAYIKPNPS